MVIMGLVVGGGRGGVGLHSVLPGLVVGALGLVTIGGCAFGLIRGQLNSQQPI
jgi:hypothetical protein